MMKLYSLLAMVHNQIHSHIPQLTLLFKTGLFSDVPLPKNFFQIIKKVFKRLYRIYGHIYYSHCQEIKELGLEAHLNTAFKHFYYFINEFDLVSKKELAPLQELIDNLMATEKE